jgi:hypothetical protein
MEHPRLPGAHVRVDAVTVRFVDDRWAVAHVASTAQCRPDGQEVDRPSLPAAKLNQVQSAWLIDTCHNTITGGPDYMFTVAPAN